MLSFFFFFKQKTAYEMRISDWSSDVCSSDLENSNYLLQTETGTYILTLYEKRVAACDLPFFLGLMEHLAERGISCPVPLHGRDGKALRQLCGRPAALVTFLEGLWPRRVHSYHCAGLGGAMARMHLAGARSEEHTSELQSLMRTSYAVFCLKKK